MEKDHEGEHKEEGRIVISCYRSSEKRRKAECHISSRN